MYSSFLIRTKFLSSRRHIFFVIDEMQNVVRLCLQIFVANRGKKKIRSRLSRSKKESERADSVLFSSLRSIQLVFRSYFYLSSPLAPQQRSIVSQYRGVYVRSTSLGCSARISERADVDRRSPLVQTRARARASRGSRVSTVCLYATCIPTCIYIGYSFQRYALKCV